ncbi:hypothetical protein O6H91_10G057700 [Diphasiastrum complanatum]|uniref:Uncharacterized protein n=1 Tax=Diphasiastrum complanatum TaxID=34168 RepID=A0ACC2CH60_DIPCM|nr:hypothetical protein O6H91_10G057700 [Diphasiastrum complanatum]
MTEDSPNFERFILNNFSSPCSDVSELLKMPNEQELYANPYSLSGFNTSLAALNLLPPLSFFTSYRNRIGASSEAMEYSALLFSSSPEMDESTFIEEPLDQGLITSDGCLGEHAKDYLAFFSNSPINFDAYTTFPLEPKISQDPAVMSHIHLFTESQRHIKEISDGVAEVEDSVESGTEPWSSTFSLECPFVFENKALDWSMMTNEGLSYFSGMAQHLSKLQCDCCQLLRCIIHSNGIQDTKLEIHGHDGQSFHAVLHTKFCIGDGCSAKIELQMVEFPVGNAEYVKQFLLQYSLLRRKEGFVLQHDSLAANTKLHQSNSLDGIDDAEISAVPIKPPKSNAAAQRERTGKLKISDLAHHFHLPINAAAKELGICPTVLKKICRRNGMRRWPHRKIKSIERIIATLEQTITEGAGQGDESIRMEIAMLKNERAQLCAGLLGES